MKFPLQLDAQTNQAHLPSNDSVLPVHLFTTASISVLANYSIYLSKLCRYVCVTSAYGKASVTQILQLVCRAIHYMQSDGCCTHLPNTINILNIFKTKIWQSHYYLAEQAMLWSAFALAFTTCASKYLNLRWSNVTQTDKITLTLHQSNTDPFWKCHQVIIFLINIFSNHKIFCYMLL